MLQIAPFCFITEIRLLAPSGILKTRICRYMKLPEYAALAAISIFTYAFGRWSIAAPKCGEESTVRPNRNNKKHRQAKLSVFSYIIRYRRHLLWEGPRP